MIGKAVLAGGVLWMAGVACASQCLDVPFPDGVEVQSAALSLNGLGVRKATFLKIRVYVAALYVPRRTANAQAILASREPFQLDLHFVRSVAAKDIRDAFEEGFAQNASDHSALQPRIATLLSWIGDVGSGESMSFVRLPERGVQFSFAGQVKGIIPGDDFARALLSLWLGANPPNAELKTGLLGGPCG